MSGFEPIVAETVAAEVGTTALASEVMAPELLAATAGAEGIGGASGIAGISGLFGSGLEGLAANGGLGALAQSAAPTMVQQLATANPVALGQLQEAVLPAMTPDQLAQITGGIPNAVGPGTQVAGGNEELMRDIIQRGTQNLAAPVAEVAPTAPVENVLSSADRAQLLSNTGYAGETGNLAKEAMYSSGYGDTAGMVTPEKSGLDKFLEKSKYLTKAKDWWDKQDDEDKLLYGAGAGLGLMALNRKKKPAPGESPYSGPLSQYGFDPSTYRAQQLAQPDPYRARYAGGGPIEQMSIANSVGANTGYPMANIGQGAYATPYQQPISRNVITDASDTGVDPITGEMTFAMGGLAVGKNPMSGRPLFNAVRNSRQPAPSAFSVPTASAPVARPVPYKARYAEGGISDLGGYSDGGRMLKGPGDGMSDDIPATISGKQPARLANEEFVIPADVVSHLGNGSSDAGAKQLYKMMDRVRQARTGKKAQGKQIKADKYMPA